MLLVEELSRRGKHEVKCIHERKVAISCNRP